NLGSRGRKSRLPPRAAAPRLDRHRRPRSRDDSGYRTTSSTPPLAASVEAAVAEDLARVQETSGVERPLEALLQLDQPGGLLKMQIRSLGQPDAVLSAESTAQAHGG